MTKAEYSQPTKSILSLHTEVTEAEPCVSLVLKALQKVEERRSGGEAEGLEPFVTS